MFGDPISVREGVTIDVELNVSANPQPSFHQWTSIRNEVQEVFMNDNGISVSLDRILFNPTSREHSGVYRLVANNSAGSSEYNFTLDVQCEPFTVRALCLIVTYEIIDSICVFVSHYI